jgi:hypothetical protein
MCFLKMIGQALFRPLPKHSLAIALVVGKLGGSSYALMGLRRLALVGIVSPSSTRILFACFLSAQEPVVLESIFAQRVE